VKTKTWPKELGGACMHDHVVPGGLVVGEGVGAKSLCYSGAAAAGSARPAARR
jgi:hypothetical protein